MALITVLAVAVTSAAAAAELTALPLDRGFYVPTDVPCGRASNATLALFRGNAISGARHVCTFQQIEQIGPTSYRIGERCELRHAMGIGHVTRVTEWEIFSRASFRHAGRILRFCPQSSLPEPWRHNDIRRLIR